MRELDTGMMMKIISDEVKKHADSLLQNYDLTMMQMHILLELYEAENNTRTMKELEKVFFVSQPAMVKLVKRLEDKKMVETYYAPDDHRVKNVHLCSEAKILCENAKKDIGLTEEKLLKNLSTEEKKLFKELLRKVYDTVIGRI